MSELFVIRDELQRGCFNKICPPYPPKPHKDALYYTSLTSIFGFWGIMLDSSIFNSQDALIDKFGNGVECTVYTTEGFSTHGCIVLPHVDVIPLNWRPSNTHTWKEED